MISEEIPIGSDDKIRMYGERLVRSRRCVLVGGDVESAANRPLIWANTKNTADVIGEIGHLRRRPALRSPIAKPNLSVDGGGVIRYGGGDRDAGGFPFWDHRRAGGHIDFVDSALVVVDDGEVGSRNRNGLAGAVDAHGFVPLEVAVIDGGKGKRAGGGGFADGNGYLEGIHHREVAVGTGDGGSILH